MRLAFPVLAGLLLAMAPAQAEPAAAEPSQNKPGEVGPAKADPALDLCRALIVQTVKTGSTFELIDSAFGKISETRAFVRLHFDALSAEGYIMQGEGTCLFDRAEPTPADVAACADCTVYTFASIRIDDDAVDLPMAEPRFSSGTSSLPK